MVSKTDRKLERNRRHARVRTKVSGTAERPRLCVYRSNTNLYAQIIDDVAEISQLTGRLSAHDHLSSSPNLRRTNRIRTIHGSLAIE